jgi:integrase
MRCLEPIWSRNPVTASRVRGRIENILDAAAARGWREGDNPARWRGHLRNLLPAPGEVQAVAHHEALPYREVAAFMVELRQHTSVTAKALEFTILTAARSGEVIGARWSEFDIDAKAWTIPAARMKAGREHRVPLSDAAMAIVEKMAAIRTSDYVFPGSRRGRPLSPSFYDLLRRRGRKGLTGHGFRSTFASWAAECTDYPYEVREMALSHRVGSAVERAYQRSDLFAKRRELMDAWGRYCGEVVTLR